MPAVLPRRRIEILADAPVMPAVIETAARAGIDHYTLLPLLAGRGHSGAWSDDQLTGALAKQMLLIVCGAERADAFVVALQPLLDSHGLMLVLSNVDVVRGERY